MYNIKTCRCDDSSYGSFFHIGKTTKMSVHRFQHLLAMKIIMGIISQPVGWRSGVTYYLCYILLHTLTSSSSLKRRGSQFCWHQLYTCPAMCILSITIDSLAMVCVVMVCSCREGFIAYLRRWQPGVLYIYSYLYWYSSVLRTKGWEGQRDCSAVCGTQWKSRGLPCPRD